MDMIDVVGYTRVSTEEQAREGISLDYQELKIRSYCATYDLNLVRMIPDPGESAKSLDRPGWREVEQMLRTGAVAGAVIYKLDRLTRSLRDWSYLIDTYFRDRLKQQRQLHSFSERIDTSTATGRMFLNVVMTIAQWEREIISERTRDNMGLMKARGERVGSVPFGKDLAEDGKTLIDNATELETIRLMKLLRGERKSFRAIAAALEALGITTKGGNEVWTPCSIQRIIERDVTTQAAG
jgi:site-specific DNA recombinase